MSHPNLMSKGPGSKKEEIMCNFKDTDITFKCSLSAYSHIRPEAGPSCTT